MSAGIPAVRGRRVAAKVAAPRKGKAEAGVAARRPGRPSRAAAESASAVAPFLSRQHIVERALELAKQEPLAELSMVRLSREFGVTPALIHYYVGSRDDLISGVVNRYFKARVERFAEPTGDWRRDLESMARITYELMVEHGGVLRYIFSHNRFRLFQKVGPGETDYGVEFLDRSVRVFRDAGFGAKHAALGYHLLMQFVLSAAYAEVGRQLPAEHERYVYEQITATPRARYGAAHYVARAFSRLDAKCAFDAGLALLLDGFAGWLK